MKKLLSQIMLILLIPLSSFASWQVQYQDIPENIRAPLLKQFPQIQKERLSKSQMDEIIRWLHDQLQADRVVFIEESPGQAKLEIKRIPRISQINFSGLSALSETEARSYIAFNKNDAYDEELLLESGEKLRQAYKVLGFLSAEIDVDMPTNEKGQLILNIRIRENKRTEITDIKIDTTDAELKIQMGKKLTCAVLC